MHRISLYLGLVISAIGCVSSGPESDWIVLDSAESVTCGEWPRTLQDLRIDDVSVVPGVPPGLFVTGVNREGNASHYFLKFDNDVDIDKDDVQQLQFGLGSVFFGGQSSGANSLALIGRNKGEKSTMELRNVASNVVEFKHDLADAEVIEGHVRSVNDTTWLLYKLDGSGVRIGRLAMAAGETSFRHLRGLEFDQYPIILPSKEKNQSLVMWSQGTTGKVFRVKALGFDGDTEKASLLEVPISAQVESWMASAHGDGYVLAYIDGDSLVGQARLRLVGFTFNYGVAQPTWNREILLNDVHVTEPVIVSRGSTLEVLLLNWVDEESTIVQYSVNDSEIAKPQFKGIFPKGSRIIDAFHSGGDDYVVLRHREGAGWTFKFCEI